MNIIDFDFITKFINLANEGWKQGWHERNGGNLSYRMTEKNAEDVQVYFSSKSDWMELGVDVSEIKGEYFLVTGSGKYFSNIKNDPEDSIGIIEIDETGSNYRILWGFGENGLPTSELPSHLMNHAVKKISKKGKHRLIYHAHTTNIIALTFVLPLVDKVFTHELWEMATECPVVFPEGVGVIEWMVPGGSKIAEATSKKMHDYNVVIWAHHGTFVSEEDFDATFGLMHTVEKSAEILVKVLSMSPVKMQTINSDQLEELAQEFDVKLKVF